jgi:hypothetical protein
MPCEEEEAALGLEEGEEEFVEIQNPFFAHWGDEAAKPKLLVNPPRYTK